MTLTGQQPALAADIAPPAAVQPGSGASVAGADAPALTDSTTSNGRMSYSRFLELLEQDSIAEVQFNEDRASLNAVLRTDSPRTKVVQVQIPPPDEPALVASLRTKGVNIAVKVWRLHATACERLKVVASNSSSNGVANRTLVESLLKVGWKGPQWLADHCACHHVSKFSLPLEVKHLLRLLHLHKGPTHSSDAVGDDSSFDTGSAKNYVTPVLKSPQRWYWEGQVGASHTPPLVGTSALHAPGVTLQYNKLYCFRQVYLAEKLSQQDTTSWPRV